MKSQGSVLIVVLGLLAILAVVGVTFVTMSSVDRTTASNFALQSQFMLAADGAVDYVSYHLVTDLWEYDVTNKKWKEASAGGGATSFVPLLSDGNGSSAFALARNEPWDSPAPTYGDPWLSPTIQSTSAPTDDVNFPYSYKNAICDTSDSYKPYGLKAWGAKGNSNATDYTYRANNLGIPGGDPDESNNIDPFRPANGVWIPDLSFPFETGLIRVSLTVIDHNSLINLNAHGNTTGPELGDLKGQGYFVSDIDPQGVGFETIRLVTDATFGLWRGTEPVNLNQMQAVIENPALQRHDVSGAIYISRPFTLDEEFELRRLRGTPFRSRLEQLGSNIMMNDPKTDYSSGKVETRLKTTTVSWTSEIRRNKYDAKAVYPPNSAGWATRKADVNFDEPAYIYQSMMSAGAVAAGQETAMKQFCANIAGFRDGRMGVGIKPFPGTKGAQAFSDTDTKNYYSASRQPLFSKVSATVGAPVNGITTWTFKLEVFNPWPADIAGMADGLTVSGMGITAKNSAAGQVPTLSPPWNTAKMQDLECRQYTLTVDVDAAHADPGAINLTYTVADVNVVLTIDQITATELVKLKAGVTLSRYLWWDYEFRGSNDPYQPDTPGHQPVFYVGKWHDGLIGTWGKIDKGNMSKSLTSGIAIRFPRSVPVNDGNTGPDKAAFPEYGLGPRATKTNTRYYRAIARLGDIDQVLCPQPADATDYWPWIIRVANADSVGTHADRLHRFDWWPASAPGEYFPPTVANYKSRLLAANALSVGGPWLDRIDNDGDGFADEVKWTGWTVNGKDVDVDDGDVRGRFGGPEMRVAGLVNLNTACNALLDAVGQGVGVADFKDKVNALRDPNSTGWPTAVILTPAALLKSMSQGTWSTDPLEQRDERFNKISNLCTVRSDTYSIYGTVQYIDPVQMAKLQGSNGDVTRRALRRSRRFWALVDRSPSAAYPPRNDAAAQVDRGFIHPRILNFQWLD